MSCACNLEIELQRTAFTAEHFASAMLGAYISSSQ